MAELDQIYIGNGSLRIGEMFNWCDEEEFPNKTTKQTLRELKRAHGDGPFKALKIIIAVNKSVRLVFIGKSGVEVSESSEWFKL